MNRAAFRARLQAAARREAAPIFSPLTLDPLTARIAAEAGFESGYVSGGGLGYQLAVSEALLTVEELAGCARAIHRRSDLAVLIDGGVGFGDPVHAARMMWEFEASGAVGVELEDQVAPKRVSHHRGVEHLVPTEEMVAKIRVAVAQRRDPDFVLIARTGACRNESYAAALERAAAYVEAGADAIMLFPTEEEQWVDAPQRLAELGTPAVAMAMLDVRPPRQWGELGYALVIDPMSGQTAAVQAVPDLYRRQLATPDEAGADVRDRNRTYRQLSGWAGLEELYDIERRTTEPGT
ncbi:MAG: isocitrate lyase/PEP mutase family protein [Acidimicrobiales bacterium]